MFLKIWKVSMISGTVSRGDTLFHQWVFLSHDHFLRVKKLGQREYLLKSLHPATFSKYYSIVVYYTLANLDRYKF